MNRLMPFLPIVCALLGSSPVSAQINPSLAKPPEDPVHAELRTLRTNVVAAISQGDFERTLAYCHSNIVVTWQNGEVCRGHQGLREFFNRLGKEAFKGYKVPPAPDELTIIYGEDTGISFGHTVASYHVLGKDFDFTNRWTATLVKENGRWQLAGYQVAINALDNPLLNGAKKGLYLGAGISGVIGLLLGILLGQSRKRAAAQPGG
jgi:ketosteroid isomerase-like protein